MNRFQTPRKMLAVAAALVAGGLVFSPRGSFAADAPSETVGWRVEHPAPVKAIVGETVTVPVTIKVLPGHYIYREKTRFLAGGETAEATAANAKLVGDVTAWPATTKHFDKFQNRDVEIYEEGTHTFPVPVTASAAGELSLVLDVKSQACTHEFCLFPHTEHVGITVSATLGKAKPTPTRHADASPAATVAAASSPLPSPAASATQAPLAAASPSFSPAIAAALPRTGTPPSASLGSVFSDEAAMANLIRDRFLLALLIAFVGGLGISLTPCVYPMVPITISVIGAHSAESRGKGFLLSLVYVAGICLVYSGLALVAGLSSREFGFLLQSPWIRLGITAVFVALAASMFGAFHLELPSSVATKLSRYQGNGLVGVFVTGMFSGLVAGPCTAPVLLGILTTISTGVVGVAGGFLLMLSFSLGMGVLFIVLGTFSGLLAALPRSGVWMVKVKHFFGFLLLGAALYYARISVPEWMFAALAGAVLVYLGTHLGAGIRLEHDATEPQRFGKAAGMVAAAAGLYMVVAGLASSGLVPSPFGSLPLVASGGTTSNASLASIGWITDEQLARAQATREGKPLLLDFFADWCEDCKALDAEVYTDPRVVNAAKEFVPLKIDTTVRMNTSAAEQARLAALQKKYGVMGLPRVLFVRPDGQVIQGLSFTGKVAPDTMLDHMTRAVDATRACEANAVAC